MGKTAEEEKKIIIEQMNKLESDVQRTRDLVLVLYEAWHGGNADVSEYGGVIDILFDRCNEELQRLSGIFASFIYAARWEV
mgnify:CR=1 FL=1